MYMDNEEVYRSTKKRAIPFEEESLLAAQRIHNHVAALLDHQHFLVVLSRWVFHEACNLTHTCSGIPELKILGGNASLPSVPDGLP